MSDTDLTEHDEYGVVETFPIPSGPTLYSVIRGDGATLAHCAMLWDAERIAACLNACEGMADPAAHVGALKTAARALLEVHNLLSDPNADPQRLSELVEQFAADIHLTGTKH